MQAVANLIYLLQWRIILTLCVICNGSLLVESASDVVQLNILFRHGDRSPVSTFPNDLIKKSAWPQGYGQLSEIGMYQHYRLGQYFRSRYVEGNPHRLLSPNYTRTEIRVRSTDYDRTLMSAYSNLAGLYPPNGSQMWYPEIKWQPIPVHTEPGSTDHLLNMDALCPKYDIEYEKLMNSKKVVEEEKRNKEFYDFMGNVSGIRNIRRIYDTLFCERTHGFPLPDWVNSSWDGVTAYEKMNHLTDRAFQLNYYEPILAKLRGGNLLGAVVSNMQSHESETTDATKCFMYSAHDSTVAAFTSAIGVYNGIKPPYATAVIVELIKSEGQYFVNILYRNDSSRDPYQLTVPGCNVPLCPLNTFIKLVQDNIPEDWYAECQSSGLKAWMATKVPIGFIAVACAGLILIMLCAVIVTAVRSRRRRNINPQYKRLEMIN